VDCPCQRTLTRKVEATIYEETSLEKVEIDRTTLITSNVSESLVIRRVHYVKVGTHIISQCGQIFHLWCTIGDKVFKMIMNGGSCTHVMSLTLISMIQLPAKELSPFRSDP